ncbi:bifunctional precorrin-2 dehydrogenase/sirohydrochlorin ferrochelatase [bacterium]|nr:bifunctional precorrin-2 dehydrogenase/sirohydrochlorin ferrochelatase [bacterium]
MPKAKEQLISFLRKSMGYYPIILDLAGKKCLIVGGGLVALRKAQSLLEAGAMATVVSPGICAELECLDGVVLHRRAYEPGDIDGCTLVFAATDDPSVNAAVSHDAAEHGILANVVDDPELCSFIVPATCRRGDLLISVTTSGKSPALSKHIREQLEQAYGPEYEPFVNLLGEVREVIKSQYSCRAEREAAFNRLISSGILELLRDGKDEQAREMAQRCI